MRAEAAVDEPEPLERPPDGADGVADLYRQEYAAMFRLAHLITGPDEVAEDICRTPS